MGLYRRSFDVLPELPVAFFSEFSPRLHPSICDFEYLPFIISWMSFRSKLNIEQINKKFLLLDFVEVLSLGEWLLI